MLYIVVGFVALLSFAGGIFVAMRLLKREYTGRLPESEKEAVPPTNPTVHEEETRRVELVDFEELFHVDGDVIEAEPATLVPKEQSHQDHNEFFSIGGREHDPRRHGRPHKGEGGTLKPPPEDPKLDR